MQTQARHSSFGTVEMEKCLRQTCCWTSSYFRHKSTSKKTQCISKTYTRRPPGHRRNGGAGWRHLLPIKVSNSSSFLANQIPTHTLWLTTSSGTWFWMVCPSETIQMLRARQFFHAWWKLTAIGPPRHPEIFQFQSSFETPSAKKIYWHLFCFWLPFASAKTPLSLNYVGTTEKKSGRQGRSMPAASPSPQFRVLLEFAGAHP